MLSPVWFVAGAATVASVGNYSSPPVYVVVNQAAAKRSWEYVYKMGYVLSRMGVHMHVYLHACCHVTFRGRVRQSYRLLVDDILFLFVLGLSLA